MTHDQHDTVIDPVCGMKIDRESAELRSEYRGEVYYFCGAGCKKAFDADPESHLQESGGHNEHHH